ncbi:Lipid A biosynthesis lauroyl acyltransferase [hydrothermal vent metagenome]|uniref:Lipid A biosynthesis lauroyl acyltransferase n=1 Tax=hydrothermal vent metagenome TaxID=652676 RepID=A0A3B0UXL3_9ZZZZ
MNLLAYILFRAFVFGVALLPLRLALALGRVLGRLGYRLAGSRRTLALSNIRRAFGAGKSEAEVRRIAAAMFRSLGMALVEFARLGSVDKAYIDKYVSFEGLEYLERAAQRGKGTVCLTAHYDNWELLNAALSLKGYPMGVVARPLDNPYLNSYTAAVRSAFGGRVIGKANALRGMLGILKGNGVLGILLDQRSSTKEGVMVDFFGTPASTSKGLAGIAIKTDTVVIPVFIRRLHGPYHKVECMVPVELARSGDRAEDIKENTRRFTRAIEDYIRRYPDQWFWLHSRWERRKKKTG